MVTIHMTSEQAVLLKDTLSAVINTFRRYPGMNIGSSEVHNLYGEDITELLSVHDSINIQ